MAEAGTEPPLRPWSFPMNFWIECTEKNLGVRWKNAKGKILYDLGQKFFQVYTGMNPLMLWVKTIYWF